MDTTYTITYDPASDYYRLLGVSPSASPEDIHRAYRERAKQVHPDRNPKRKDWAHKAFKGLNNINNVLSDPVLRAEYDRQRAAYLLSLFGEPQAQAQEWETTQARQYSRPTAAPSQSPRRKTSKFFVFLLILVGMCAIVAGIGLGITDITDVQNSPLLSTSFTLDEIIAMNSLPAIATVKLTGLDCASLKDSNNKTEAILPSADQRTVAVIWFSSIRTCPEIEQAAIAGSIQPLVSGVYNKLVTDGAFVNYPKATTFIDICENCGSSAPSAMGGIAAFVGFMGLYVIWLGISKLRAGRK